MRRAYVVIVAAGFAGCSSSEPRPVAEDTGADAPKDTSFPVDAPDTDLCCENPPWVGDVAIESASPPTFSPPAGTYAKAQEIALTSATPGAKIYYTADGTTPNVSSPLYTAPISVTKTTTLKAIAIAPGFRESAVAIGAYTVEVVCVVHPVQFAPAGGTYAADQLVTLSSETAAATICYTLDGAAPACNDTAACTSGATYTGPITITPSSAGVTVTSIACKTGMGSSCATKATYKRTS